VAATLVQRAWGHTAASVYTFSLSFPQAVTPGDTVFAHATSYFADVSTADSIDDNQGNGLYTRDVCEPPSGGQAGNIGFYRKTNVAASGTFTVNYNKSVANGVLYIAEFSGLSSGAPDASTQGTQGNEFPCPVGPLTPTQAGCLFISCYEAAGMSTGQTPSISSNPDNFTVLDVEPDGSTYAVGGWAYLAATDALAKQLTWTHAGTDGVQNTAKSLTAYAAGPPPPPPQALRPDADLAATGWSTAPLWSKVDEASAGGDVISAVSA
jgi:hypothetical protein